MLAASHSLISEGTSLDVVMTLLGVLIGIGAIVAADRLLTRGKPVDVADLEGANAAKALLILGIMTAHSFAEGSVSACPLPARRVWVCSSPPPSPFTTCQRGSPSRWCWCRAARPSGRPRVSIFTSLPQPIMAAPAYLFVETFRPFLPVGLGLAAGAMIWMVFAELFTDALEDVTASSAATAVALAMTLMLAFQMLVLAH